MTKEMIKRRKGQTMMEYVLILCLIAAAIAATVYFFGDKLKAAFDTNTGVVEQAIGTAEAGSADIGSAGATDADGGSGE